MKHLRSALSLAGLFVLCASVASCADAPSRRYGPQAQDDPTARGQPAGADPGAPKPALTIQSGEGEKLNIPWFVRDVQDWVNQGSAPETPWRTTEDPTKN